MKRSVRQIDIGQHHNQKHEKYHATEDEESRRLYVPLRHSPFSFARVEGESQPLKMHKAQNRGLGVIIHEKLEMQWPVEVIRGETGPFPYANKCTLAVLNGSKAAV
jgi:hypothetical protein